MANITWDNAPNYDEWGYDDFWSCNDWITWHKKLAEHFGEETATEIWNYAFDKTTNLSSNLDCNALDANFRKYVKEHGLRPNSDIITETMGTASDILTDALGATSDVSSGLFDTVGNFFGGNNLKRTINIVLIAGGVIGIAYVYRTFKK